MILRTILLSVFVTFRPRFTDVATVISDLIIIAVSDLLDNFSPQLPFATRCMRKCPEV